MTADWHESQQRVSGKINFFLLQLFITDGTIIIKIIIEGSALLLQLRDGRLRAEFVAVHPCINHVLWFLIYCFVIIKSIELIIHVSSSLIKSQ